MSLNIKNKDVDRLAAEIADATGETKTEAIRKALEERKRRLVSRKGAKRPEDIVRFLEREVWSEIPKRLQGKRLSRKAWEKILGYGPEGA